MNCELVADDLLAFLQQKKVNLDERFTPFMLTRKFSDDEIYTSKQVLFSVLNKSDQMEPHDNALDNIQDIITIFKKTHPSEVPTFVAKELLQLDVTSLLKDIVSLKASLADMQSKLKGTGTDLPKESTAPRLRILCGTAGLRRKKIMEEVPIVSVEQGQLQGCIKFLDDYDIKHFYSFQGIPYAKPPLGALRFKAPQPPEPWEGIRTATSEGNMTPQFDVFFSKAYAGDENCLFLNIYTRKFQGSLPVMIFIHGGGFSFGSGNTDLYGADYLVMSSVVVVTMNYRCGALGFLSLNIPEVSGNAGLKDIVQAIKWVKSNIQNFGGDPDNITIFGESAGGAAVCYLTVSPLTKKLVHKAIIQSGTALATFALQKKPLENARTLAKTLGSEASDPEEILEFLRTCSAKEIVEAQQKMNPLDKFPEKLNDFSVVIEKEFLGVEAVITESFYDSLTSGRVAEIPIMIGACSLEYTIGQNFDDLQLFIPEELNIKRDSAESLEIVEKLKKLYFEGDNPDGSSELISDRIITVDTNRVVQHLVRATNNTVYYYNFDYVGTLNIFGKLSQQNNVKRAGHMDELGYLFKNDFQKGLKLSPQDTRVQRWMVCMWTNFAKYGNPTPPKVERYTNITWLPVTKDNQYCLNIGPELTLQSDIKWKRKDFWDNLYSKYLRICEKPKTTVEVPVKYDPPSTVNVSPAKANAENEVNNVPDEVPVKYKPPYIFNGSPAKAKAERELNNASDEASVKYDRPFIVNGSPAKAQAESEVKAVIEAPAPAVFQVQSAMLKQTIVRANDPPEDDLPKNIGVNKFISLFDSLAGKNN